jgi:Secretion system C-terminal sorting domain
MLRFSNLVFFTFLVLHTQSSNAQLIGRITNASGGFSAVLNGTQVSLYLESPGAPIFVQDLPLSPTHTFIAPNAPVPPTTAMLYASKDDNWLYGIDVLDILKIQRHILGLEPLPSPFLILAADVNNSNSVTSSDIVELRKLILGSIGKFQLQQSFSFVPRTIRFLNPNNPWQVITGDTDVPYYLMHPDSIGFIGYKNGDVYGNTVAQLAPTTPAKLNYPHKAVKAGDIFELKFTCSKQVSAMQFTLEYPGLELLEVMPGSAMYDTDFQKHTNSLTCAWVSNDKIFQSFTLKFRAIQGGKLSKFLKMSDQITSSLVYDLNLDRHQLKLSSPFGSAQAFEAPAADRSADDVAPILSGLSVAPNPAITTTNIQFELAEASQVQIRLMDLTGKLIFEQSQYIEAGKQAFEFTKPAGLSGGMYHLVLQANTTTQAMKLQFSNE